LLEPLRRVDVERDVEEARVGELVEQVARPADSVGEQRGSESGVGDAAHDRDELLARTQRRISSRHLDADSRTVDLADALDPLEHDLERKVLNGLRALREVAERAVEIAALRDLERHASDGGPTAQPLVRRAELRVETLPGSPQQLFSPREIGIVDGKRSPHRRMRGQAVPPYLLDSGHLGTIR